MKRKIKISLLLTAFCMVFASISTSLSLFVQTPNELGFNINIKEVEEKYYVSINNGDKQEMTMSDGVCSYTYNGDLLLDYSETIKIYDNNDTLLNTYTSNIDGIYNSTFTYTVSSNSINISLYKTKIYLSDLNAKGVCNRITFWNNFYVYVYGGSGEDDTQWPGDAMTLYTVGSKELYVSEGYYLLESQNVVFNNGESDNDLVQTPDLSFNYQTPVYKYTSHKGGSWSDINDCDTAYTDLTSNYDMFLYGSMNSWGASTIYGFEKGNSGYQYFLKANLSSGNEFKFYKSGWYGYKALENINTTYLSGSGDSNIKVNKTGIYTFYFKTGTSKAYWTYSSS